MNVSSGIAKTLVTAAAVILLAMPVLAGNGPGDGTGNGGSGPKDGTGNGLKKGSCLRSEISRSDAIRVARGGNGRGGCCGGPGDGTGNGGNGPKDGSGNGKKSGTCVNS